MKLSRLLLLAGASVAIGYFLTRTESGNKLRRNISDRTGDWTKRLRKLRDDSVDYSEDFLQDTTNVKRKKRAAANGQIA